jgi:hypothetical protein
MAQDGFSGSAAKEYAKDRSSPAQVIQFCRRLAK